MLRQRAKKSARNPAADGALGSYAFFVIIGDKGWISRGCRCSIQARTLLERGRLGGRRSVVT